MKISHYFNLENQIQQEAQAGPGFFLANKLGGYLWMNQDPQSRYQGWFFSYTAKQGQRKMIKVLENIEVSEASAVTFIQNNYWFSYRKRSALRESFFMPSYLNAMVYETSRPCCVEISLDIKDSYDSKESGREYQIKKIKNLIVVKYIQEGSDLPVIFLAMKFDKGEAVKLSQWVLRNYNFDRDRNSVPFSRYIFKAIKLGGASKVVMAVGKTEKQAIKKAEYVFKNTAKLKDLKEKEAENFLPKKLSGNKEIDLAFISAKYALDSFVAHSLFNNAVLGIVGGLPWFFQFWPRDEAISLKALAFFNKEEAENILKSRVVKATRFRNVVERDISQKEADALGWIFKRFSDFSQEKIIQPETILNIKDLGQIIDDLLEKETEDGLAYHNPKETWMDTIDRSSCCIEIQALRLNLYNLATRLSGIGEKKEFYLKLERDLKRKTRENFWNNQILADGFDQDKKTADFTIRPNVFLAAYIYPDLLTDKEWIKCFENILPKIWLPWGGIATIDKSHSDFRASHTGEIPLSYHNGDSWFYLNNLAALVMNRLDAKKFAPYIESILQASVKEILWNGIVGYHGELSSAGHFASQGCLAQAWSNALFIELIKEKYKI